jgi:AGCS family alanine or glycine:cation symporter
MESIERFVETISHFVWNFGIPVGGETIPLVVLALMGTGVYLTLRLRFVQVRRLGHGVAVASGKYDDPHDPGDVSHFQALSTALSATVGIGNIAGVAIAIHFGGPGALFWMWMTALLGMATKYAEVTLAQKYRSLDDTPEDGTVAGGPMYYIERGLGPSFRWLALLFATLLGLTAFLTGNGVQANTVADTVLAVFGLDTWITGAILAALLAAVILGGIRRIGRVTAILAPAMAVIYVVAALVVLAIHAGEIGPTLALIVREAFSPSAGVAGTGVGAVLVTMMWGVKRGLFSNEAGQGSAPIAHAAAKTDEPVSEGVVALLEPFIDTIIICTMTALVVVITGAYKDRVPTEVALSGGDLGWVLVESDGTTRARRATASDGAVHERLYADAVESGAPLTMEAFRKGLSSIGDFGHYVVLLCVVLFGISTAISWSYYGDRCAHYVLGPKAVKPYKLVFVAMHFLGAVVPLSLAWTLGDVFLGAVIVPNLLALVLLAPQVVEMTDSYFRRKPWRDSPRGADPKAR